MHKTSIKSTKATKKEQRDNMIQHRTWQNGPVIVRGVLGQVAHLPCLVHPTTPLGEYYEEHTSRHVLGPAKNGRQRHEWD